MFPRNLVSGLFTRQFASTLTGCPVRSAPCLFSRFGSIAFIWRTISIQELRACPTITSSRPNLRSRLLLCEKAAPTIPAAGTWRWSDE